MAKETTITLTDEQALMVKAALSAADKLCTSVISGSEKQIDRALDVARALGELQKHKVLR